MKTDGKYYEDAAEQLLRANGVHILARNFATKTGEIDIICRQDNTLVFVEVRARSNARFASAAASVDSKKQQRLIRTAHMFLQRNKQWSKLPCRFDVIAFEPRQLETKHAPTWIRSAFTA
ncbi:MAG: putative endonuclease [Halioglobus sp.]|jgi:putative endonuclease